MYIRKTLFTLTLFCALLPSAHSQSIVFPFGEVSQSDLEMKVYLSDPDASAVILSDQGKANLVLVSENFTIELERNVKIKILNSQGFDYANVEIPYATGDKLLKVRATTYNLINDSIVATSVNKKEFILDKSNKYYKTLRIAFPNVGEGSIIEYQYKLITEDIYNFVAWNFQSEIPTRYSDFTAIWNDFFDFNGLVKGDVKSITRVATTETAYVGDYKTSGSKNRWVGAKIPAFRHEPFITGKNDHLIRLEFELAGTSFPRKTYHVLTPTYNDLPKKMLDRSDFGTAIEKAAFLLKPTQEIVKDCADDLAKIEAIHRYVSNSIIWDGKQRYGVQDQLRKVYNKKRGNSAEINLMLIAMLRHAGLNAHPVMLSTRSNGQLHPSIAMIHKFNYVVAAVTLENKTYLVDATDPLLPFNVLPFYCLNGNGRLIHASKSQWVALTNGEQNLSSYNAIAKVDESGTITGKVQNSYGGYDAYQLRKFIKLESLKGYNDLLAASNPNWEIRDIKFQNQDSLSANFVESFKLKIDNGAQSAGDRMILNPFLFLSEDSNPFSSEERKYPIDFGCPEQTTYNLTLTIPYDYEVEEMPSSVNLILPNREGSFIMTCEHKNNTISIQSRFMMNQVRFNADDYKLLREFYAQIIRKQSELIVLKKI